MALMRQVMSPSILYRFDDETVVAVLKNMDANQVRRLIGCAHGGPVIHSARFAPGTAVRP